MVKLTNQTGLGLTRYINMLANCSLVIPYGILNTASKHWKKSNPDPWVGVQVTSYVNYVSAYPNAKKTPHSIVSSDLHDHNFPVCRQM